MRSLLSLVFLLSLLGLLTACSAQTPEEHLASARAYLTAGEDDAAILELKNALKKDPDLAAARAELGRLQFSAGDYPAAEAELQRALAGVLPGDERQVLQEQLWLTQIRLQQAAGVIAELDLQASLPPARRALLGVARLAMDDVELAAEEFARALADGDDVALAHYGQARISWQAGETEAARKSFVRAAQLAQRDPELLLTKAEFELGLRELDAARSTFEQARGLPGPDVAARLGITRVLVFEKNYEGAEAELSEVLQLAPGFIPALYLEALVAYEQEDLDSAELTLRKVLSAESKYAPALYLIGAVQFQQQDFLQAESNLSTYLTENPGNVSARKLLGAVRMQSSNYEGVVEALGPLAGNSSDAQSLAMLGTAYARLNRLNEASALLERAVELAPEVGELRNQLAVTLLAADNNEQAIGQLRSAIDLDGELQLSDYLLVLAQLKQGKVPEALAAANALRARQPGDPMGDNLLGAVRFSEGNIPAARAAFDAALKKRPSFQPAALNLVRLELAEGNRDAAIAGLNRLLAADDSNERALLQLAELLIAPQRGQQVETSDVNERAQSINSARQLLVKAANAHEQSLAPKLALARLGLFSKDVELALARSEQAMNLAPDNPNVLIVRAESLLAAGERAAAKLPLKTLSTLLRDSQSANLQQRLRLAQLHERAGQPQLARTFYIELESGSGPPSDAARLALARFDLRNGETAAARGRLQSVSAEQRSSTAYRLLSADVLRLEGDSAGAAAGYSSLLAEDNRDALFRLVALYTGSGESARANKLMAQWSESHPNDAGVDIALATQALTAGDYETARNRFEGVLGSTPDNVVVLNNLAWLYQQTGDPRAQEVAKKAWQLAPQSADVGDTYGWILVNSGEAALGRQVLTEAHRLAPRNASIAYHAAKALADSGRTEQALATLRSVGEQRLASSPDAEDALALLRELVAVNEVEVDAEAESELIE